MSLKLRVSGVDPAPVRPLLLCFSHLRWHFVTQRPQHLLRWAAHAYAVVFLEEPVYGADRASLRTEMADGITLAVPLLPDGLREDARDRMLASLLAEHLGDRADAIFWYYTPAAWAFSRALPRALTIYDNMDELSAFRGASPDLLRLEEELLAGADLVFTGGRSLYEAKRERHDDVHCFPSAVDAAHFGRAREPLAEPADLADIPHPRLGFYGVVDERMDLGFVAAFAALRPDWQFVILGPVVKIDPADLPRPPNLHWLGMKRYEELPAYLAHWDLAFMPFALNESTRFISPTKTPEFLAGGLRVLSTPVADVVHAYGGADALVTIVDTPAAAAQAAAWAIDHPPGADWLRVVDARLADGSWERTWDAMRGLIDAALLRRSDTRCVAVRHGERRPSAEA